MNGTYPSDCNGDFAELPQTNLADTRIGPAYRSLARDPAICMETGLSCQQKPLRSSACHLSFNLTGEAMAKASRKKAKWQMQCMSCCSRLSGAALAGTILGGFKFEENCYSLAQLQPTP